MSRKCNVDISKKEFSDSDIMADSYPEQSVEEICERIRKKILLYPQKWLRRDWIENLINRAPLNQLSDTQFTEEDWEKNSLPENE